MRTEQEGQAFPQVYRDWVFLLTYACMNVHVICKLRPLSVPFVQKPNTVLSRERLTTMIDPQSKATSRSVDVLITRLRRKLRDDAHHAKLIVTVHGVGYIFAAETY